MRLSTMPRRVVLDDVFAEDFHPLWTVFVNPLGACHELTVGKIVMRFTSYSFHPLCTKESIKLQ